MRLKLLILTLLLCAATAARADFRQELIARADTANAPVLYQLYEIFDSGAHDLEPDKPLALKYLQQAADSLYPAALNMLGFKTITGQSVERNPAEGLRLIEKAASLGYPKAFSNLGWLLADGSLVERDDAKALYWLRRGAEQNFSVAQTLLADMYRTGTGMERPDTLAADSLYISAIRQGMADADRKLLDMNHLRWETLTPQQTMNLGAELYYDNALISGVYLLQKAEKEGFADAAFLLADASARGAIGPNRFGGPENLELTSYYLLKAARGGNPAAAWIIGDTLGMYPEYLDAARDLSADEKTQEYWYEKARLGGISNADEALYYKVKTQ